MQLTRRLFFDIILTGPQPLYKVILSGRWRLRRPLSFLHA